MRKKLVCTALALAFMLAANLNVCCRVSINGRELEGLYSPAQLKRCEKAAAAAAEEILPGHAVGPLIERKYSLSFVPARGGLRGVTDSLLCSYTGVKSEDGVFVNGVFLGVVEDGAVLREKLKGFIENQMPNRAVFGNISGKLEIREVYTRANRRTNDEDMLLLISGAAPVIYLDSEGRLA